MIDWEANSSPVPVDPGIADDVTISSLTYSPDQDYVRVISTVTDAYGNPIIGETAGGKLYYKDGSGSTISGTVDVGDGTYYVEYPIKAVASNIELFGFDPNGVNDVNARKVFVSGNTISNGVIELYIDGLRVSQSGGVISDSDGNFRMTADKILSYGRHDLKFTVAPMGGGSSSTTVPISVFDDNISDPIKKTDTVNIQAGGTSGEKTYVWNVTKTSQNPRIVPFAQSGEYSTPQPTLFGTALPGGVLHILSGATVVGKSFADEYGMFSYPVRTSVSGGFTYRVVSESNPSQSGAIALTINAGGNAASLSIDSILNNSTYTSTLPVVTGFGKPGSVIKVEKVQGTTVTSIDSFVIDQNGRFDYVVDSTSIVSGVNTLKFTNKLTGYSTYATFTFAPDSDCTVVDCSVGIASYGVSKKGTLVIRGYTQNTKINTSVVYVYARPDGTSDSENELIGVIHTEEQGLFTFESLNPFGSGAYIITLKRSDSVRSTTFLFDTSVKTGPQ